MRVLSICRLGGGGSEANPPQMMEVPGLDIANFRNSSYWFGGSLSHQFSFAFNKLLTALPLLSGSEVFQLSLHFLFQRF
jgi:hypothetical protein